MCTLVTLRRPELDWPVVIGTNRDESLIRSWKAPARHWPDRPKIVGGLDLEAGGTWLGINDYGVVAIILNRKRVSTSNVSWRSRGELPLKALNFGDALTASKAFVSVDPDVYQPFNLIVCDNKHMFWISNFRSKMKPEIKIEEVPVGLSMFTSGERNDINFPRIRYFLPKFNVAAEPDVESNEWSDWISLLSCANYPPNEGPESAMCITTERGFGTVCSSLIALPSQELQGVMPKFWFIEGLPENTGYKLVDLS